MNIVFMGSADFGLPVLEKLLQSEHSISGIVSTPEKEKGRGLKPALSPVVQFSKLRGLGPILTPEQLNTPEFVSALLTLNADIFIVVAFRILPKSVFTLPALGTVNIHASLLPQYRGPAPIQRAIAAGESQTGITIFRIDEGIDTGTIILQKNVAIGESETTPQLYKRLSLLGAESIMEAVSVLQRGDAVLTKQDASKASRAPKLLKAEGNIDWNLPARSIFNSVRAFKPFPGSFSFLQGRRIGIEWAIPIESGITAAPGTIFGIGENGIDVHCGTGGLRITDVKPEGKNTMSAMAFAAGRNIAIGCTFAGK